MVRLVDRGGVVIIAHSLDVGMNILVVEVPGVSCVDAFLPLEEGVCVVVTFALFAAGVSVLVDD